MLVHDFSSLVTIQVETAKEHTVELLLLYEDIYIVVPHCLSETSAGVHSNLQTIIILVVMSMCMYILVYSL